MAMHQKESIHLIKRRWSFLLLSHKKVTLFFSCWRGPPSTRVPGDERRQLSWHIVYEERRYAGIRGALGEWRHLGKCQGKERAVSSPPKPPCQAAPLRLGFYSQQSGTGTGVESKWRLDAPPRCIHPWDFPNLSLLTQSYHPLRNSR